MKMVKSLLLGTAAGLVAVAGAQAADMPVKAAPVQYVKICTLYGDGFYYIPGTDICLKIGGYVRGEYFYNYGVSGTNGSFQAGSPAIGSGYRDRFDGNDFLMRARAYAWFDSRQQTEYGTLRSYLQIGLNYDSPAASGTGFNANRAFIQFAGFTVGVAQSFFDFYSSPASSYFGTLASDTGDGGWKVFAYTHAVRQRLLVDVLVRRAAAFRYRPIRKPASSTRTSATRASSLAPTRLTSTGRTPGSPTSCRTGASTRPGAVLS